MSTGVGDGILLLFRLFLYGGLSSVSRLTKKQIAALAVFSRNYCSGGGL